MTDGPPAASDAIELKLRGLERLRTAGMVGEAEYNRMRAKLLADAPAAPPPPAAAARRGSPRTPDYLAPAGAVAAQPAPAPAPPPAAAAASPAPAPPPVAPSPPPFAPSPPPPAPTPFAPPPPVTAAPTVEPAPPVAPMPSPAFILAPPPTPAPASAAATQPTPSPAPAAVATAPSPVTATWSIRTTDQQAPVAEPAAPAAAAPSAPPAAPQLAPREAWAPTTVEPPPAPATPAPAAPWPPVAPPAPRPQSSSPWIAVIAIVGVLAAGSAAYLAFGRGTHAPGSASAPANGQPGSGSASGSSSGSGPKTYATLDAFVPDAKAFVEQHRNLAWQQPVTVVGLDDAAFEAKFLDSEPVSPTGSEGDDIVVREFKALHIVPQTFDPKALTGTASASGVEGFYDFKTKELYVRGTKPTPYTREVVVHELTHALQDQWYGLGKLFEKNDIGGESVEAFLAVVEGDATRIERQYRDSLSPAEQQQAAAAAGGTLQQQQALSSIPKAFLTLSSFPYGAGLQFDQAVMDTRGQSALDAAFRSPPTTTAEVLDPQRYINDIQSVDVPPPDPAGTPFDVGSLGGLGFTLVFGSLPGMTQSQAVLAADAWEGDTYVAYTTGGRSCVRDTVVAQSVGAQRGLDSTLQKWVASSPAISVTAGALDGSGPVTFTACTG